MNKNNKWSSLIDYFLLLGAIVGVGFASGKEVYNFFVISRYPYVGLVSFLILYFFLFFFVDSFNNKYSIRSYDRFSRVVFNKFSRICNIIMIINFSITSAGMLASCRYLFDTIFGRGGLIVALCLGLLEVFVLIKGTKGLKTISNILVPLMLITIITNSINNISFNAVVNTSTKGSIVSAISLGLIFGLNNYISAIPILVESRLKRSGKTMVIISIGAIVLLNILVLTSNGYASQMPLLELSGRLGKGFYYMYFTTIIFALLTTYMVCSQNIYTIMYKGNKSIFGAVIIVLACLIMSNLGFEFIVKYLYLISGIISGVMVGIMVFAILVKSRVTTNTL